MNFEKEYDINSVELDGLDNLGGEPLVLAEAGASDLKRLKKSLIKKNIRIAAMAVAVVVIPLLLWNFVVFPLGNALYYNPMSWVTDDEGFEWRQLDEDWQVFSWLHMPNIGGLYVFDIQNTFPGRYKVTIAG